MLFRIAVLVLGVSYVSYRLRLAVQLGRAKRRGDTARVDALQARSFWLVRWAVGAVLVLLVLLTILLVLESR